MKLPKMLGYVTTGTVLFLASLLIFSSLAKTSLGSFPLAIFVIVFPISNDLVIQSIPLAVTVASALLGFAIAGWIFWRESLPMLAYLATAAAAFPVLLLGFTWLLTAGVLLIPSSSDLLLIEEVSGGILAAAFIGSVWLSFVIAGRIFWRE
jgi:hypothetical protein